MVQKKVDLETFYNLLMVDKLSKNEIMKRFDIGSKTYQRWKTRAKALCLTEISMNSMEQELVNSYNTTDNNKDKMDLRKLMVRFLDIKQKANSLDEESEAEDADAIKKLLQAARQIDIPRTA